MVSPAALGYAKMVELHDYVQFFLVVILFFVLWFYVNIILDFGDFNTKHNPKFLLEKTYTHIKARNIAHIGWLEVVWTIIPIIILTAIAIPSFKLLYALDVVNSPLLTLRCIGNQWYWTYECDITKPDVLPNLQKYLANGILVKQEQIPVNLSGRPNPILINGVIPFTENSEIENNEIDITEDFNESYDDYILARKKYLDNVNLRLQYFRAVYFGHDEMHITYVSDICKIVCGKVSKNAYNIEEIQNSILDIPEESYAIDDSSLEFIKKVVKHTERFHTDAESFAVDSYLLDADDLQLGAFRLLEVDNFPKLPADAEIRLAVTGTDVIHSFAVPSLGVKIDAIPGRLNQFGIRVRVPGTYYGQCSELCGVGHGFMPIKVQFLKFIK